MCLFNNFLDYYGKVFEVPKNYSSSLVKIQHARYTWADNQYRVFIRNLLRVLEPIKYEPGELLREELDEFTEVIFMMDGFFEIGYTINQMTKYVLKYDKNEIGAYNVTFFKRSLFNYRVCSNKRSSGYFIRAINWLTELIQNEECQEFTDKVRIQLAAQYKTKIKTKVMRRKVEDLQKFKERNDYDTIMSVAFIKKDVNDDYLPKENHNLKQYQEPADIEEVLKDRSVIEWNLSNLEDSDLDLPEAIDKN